MDGLKLIKKNTGMKSAGFQDKKSAVTGLHAREDVWEGGRGEVYLLPKNTYMGMCRPHVQWGHDFGTPDLDQGIQLTL